jgi:PAS domain S-box-containing protein
MPGKLKKDSDTNFFQNIEQYVSDRTTDEIIITDKNENILYVNPAFTKITGYSPEEVLGKKPSLLRSGKHTENFFKKMKNTLNKGDVYKNVMINKHKDGKILYEEKVIVPVKNPKGLITGYVSTGRDITEKINLELDLKKYIKELKKNNADLEKFIYRASHDLRGPVASIIGVTSLFKDEIKDEKALKYFDFVKECAQNLDEVLKNMLHLQILFKDKPKATEINFSKLIEGVLGSFNYYEGFSETEFIISDASAKNFYSQEKMLFSIFQNLIHNSVKFKKLNSTERPVVKITIKNTPEETIIEIEDNGMGIKKDHQSKIFEMFYRANSTHRGSGLGLYFVKQMLNHLEGDVTVWSKEKQGSLFRIALPKSTSAKSC